MRPIRIVRAAALGVALCIAATGCAFVTRSSVPSGGAPPEGNGASLLPSVSDDGRYTAFISAANNLVPGDVNGQNDAFVTDHLAHTTTRVSIASNGNEANGPTLEAAISANGRVVAFSSVASNLVAGDNNNVSDVFMHDRSTGNTARISVNAGGAQGNGPSFAPSVSATGQIVSFHSSATNLVPADNNNVDDVFRFDVVGLLDRVSINNGGGQGNGASTLPAISADGSMIAFQSAATNLVAGDVNGVQDVFVHDFVAGTTVRASVATGGAQPLLASAEPAISGDGTMVAFHSRDLGLVPGFGNTLNQVYVRSLVAGTTVPVSTTSAGLAGNGKSLRASLDETGQFIAFESDASDLVTSDLNVSTDAFVRDLTQPGATRVSLDKNGVEANGSSLSAALSRDGRYVAFSSSATNLVPGDANVQSDVFTRAAVTPVVESIAPATGPPGGATFVTISGSGFLPNATVAVGSADVVANGVNVVDANTITAMFAVAPAAPLGSLTVLVTNPGAPWSSVLTGAVGTCTACFTVV